MTLHWKYFDMVKKNKKGKKARNFTMVGIFALRTRDVPIRFFCAPEPIRVIEYWVSADTESRSETRVFLVLDAQFKYIRVIKINPMYTELCIE